MAKKNSEKFLQASLAFLVAVGLVSVAVEMHKNQEHRADQNGNHLDSGDDRDVSPVELEISRTEPASSLIIHAENGNIPMAVQTVFECYAGAFALANYGNAAVNFTCETNSYSVRGTASPDTSIRVRTLGL